MTDPELRLKCLEVIMPSACRLNMTNGEIFSIAEQAYIFATKTTGEKSKGQASAPKDK